MKSLLATILTLTTVLTPIMATTNVVNSKLNINSSNYHKNLATLPKSSLLTTTHESNINLTITLGKTYSDIDKSIYNTANVFKEKPLFGDYTVDYFRDEGNEKKNINQEAQMVGDVYVIITADLHDPNWKGKTDYLKITITSGKRDLHDITFTIKEPLPCIPNQKYEDFDKGWVNYIIDVFQNQPLAPGFTVDYFADGQATQRIDDNVEAVGKVWVKIIAADNDPYWTGTTVAVQITFEIIDKEDLSGIDLEDITIVLVANKENKDIDLLTTLNAMEIFKNKELSIKSHIQYFSDEIQKTPIDDNFQVAGNIWFGITADNDDLYWKGKTKIIKLTLVDERVDLNTISDLSGMDEIIVDPNATYQQINKNVINTADQLKVDPLTGNFTIHYFSDITANHNIDNHYQQVGSVYVIITPDYSSSTKWKVNKTPIIFTIVE